MAAPEVLSRIPIKGAVSASGGAASAQMLPILDENGQLDPSFIPGAGGSLFFESVSVPTGSNYFTVDITSAGFPTGKPTKVAPFMIKPDSGATNIWVNSLVIISNTSLGIYLSAPPAITGYMLTILAA